MKFFNYNLFFTITNSLYQLQYHSKFKKDFILKLSNDQKSKCNYKVSSNSKNQLPLESFALSYQNYMRRNIGQDYTIYQR